MQQFLRLVTCLSCLVFCLSALPAPAQAQDDDQTGFIGRQIENALSGSGRVASVSGFSGLLSGQAQMDRLTFADDQGVWLVLENATLDWQRSALLRRELRVAELTAERLEILRRPIPSDDLADDVPDANASGFKIPDLPVVISIDQVGIDRVVLGDDLLGAAAELSLEGQLSLANGDLDTDLSVIRLDGPKGAITLSAMNNTASSEFSIDLQATEDQGGLIGALLNIPDNPALDLTLTGAGPVSDFRADLRLATDGQERLQGRFIVAALDDGAQRFDGQLGGDISAIVAPQYRDFFGPDLSLIARGTKSTQGGLELAEFSLTAQSLDLTGAALISADGVPERFDLSGRIADPDGGRVSLPAAARCQCAGCRSGPVFRCGGQ